ncbi:hypothetical protein EUTSA_v10021559mg [Eutrema salsugineum]|uniref:Uncharacterized protein n=1 Tax=Eutrema salsugineum TaxID=72664 RepID=V4M1L1_EUTSA|nr:uncharacterized protein LOC18025178 [Eutrema salsugineum]ESQ48712.1 hypothetical protein EUTSA_v10021559mg [Eutrema salsugineum]
MDQMKPELLKKLTKFIIVSIWVLALLTTHKFDLSRFTIQLITHAVDKKYMFLLCNGLLVLVAKYPGLIASSKPLEEISKTNNTFVYRDFDSYNAILELEDCSVHGGGTESFLAEEVSTKDQEIEEVEKEEEEEEYDEPLTNNGDLEEDCDIPGGSREDEDNLGVVTEEEMNKKFDEFIRKMKEELRIEAKRHLVLV